jgi:hypothetical protein
MASHLQIAYNALQIVKDYPLGIGFNDFSIAYEMVYGQKGYGTHNAWLTYLVEIGPLGLAFQLFISFFIIRYCFRHRTPLSIAFVSSYIGVCFASLGYELKSTFSFQFYTVVLFSFVCLEQMKGTEKNASKLKGVLQ